MPEKKPRKPQANVTASATDCTGLMPALPEDPMQVGAYEALYPFEERPTEEAEEELRQ